MKSRIFSKKKAAIILWFASLLFSSTSCSAFFDSGYTISDIKKTEDENGNTILEIVFDDDNIEPIKVSINNGVGIDNVSSTLKDGKLYLTISYTDNREDTVLEIPVLEGEKGVSVVDINTTTDDDGNIKVVFVFSDGTQSNEIIIPKGNNGVGIQNISCTLDENTNIYKLIFTLSDGSEIGPFFINNGTDGKEIVSVNTTETENNYILEIVYSDGTSSPVVLSKPTSNRWYYGSTVPEEDLGKEGDFYFLVTDKCIYTKTALGWNLLISLDGQKEDKYYRKVREMFQSDAAKKFFRTELLLKMLDEHKNGKHVNEKTDNSRKIWTVYIFLVWYDRFFEHGKPMHPAMNAR